MEVTIYGEVGLWPNTFANIRNLTKDATDLELRINSPGGDVIEGMAIASMLAARPGKVVAYIDGWAASIASVIIAGATEVHAPENAWVMIHNPWTVVGGESEDLRRYAEVLDKMRDQIVSMYMRKAKVAREKIIEMMDAETWMTAQEAYDIGFVTHLTQPMEMAACWDVSKRPSRAPEAAIAAITKPQGEPPVNIMDWLKACPIVGASEQILSEAAAEHLRAECDTRIAAAKAEADEAKAAADTLKAECTSRIDAMAAELAAKVAEAEAKQAEMQARLETMAGGLKTPADNAGRHDDPKVPPATAAYLARVKAIVEAEQCDYDHAVILAQARYPEEFAAMKAEYPSKTAKK